MSWGLSDWPPVQTYFTIGGLQVKFQAVSTDYEELQQTENDFLTGILFHNRVNHKGTKEMYYNARKRTVICRHGTGNWAAYELNENNRIGYEIEWIVSLPRLKNWMREEDNRFALNGRITLAT